MFDSLSAPMRMLLSRVAVLLAGGLVGLGVYALDVGGILVVPLAVVGVLAAGELYFFTAGETT